jgi:organic hydroperoxide reductase OsmC/OhrA
MAQSATSKHCVRVEWEPERDDPRAHLIKLSDQVLAGSSAETFGGDSAKADPEELFVAALSSCHMLWFISLARAKRLRVTAYVDDAQGTMDATHFTAVLLRPKVSFEQDPVPEHLIELHHRAHERCYIAHSVNCPVVIEPQR